MMFSRIINFFFAKNRIDPKIETIDRTNLFFLSKRFIEFSKLKILTSIDVCPECGGVLVKISKEKMACQNCHCVIRKQIGTPEKTSFVKEKDFLKYWTYEDARSGCKIFVDVDSKEFITTYKELKKSFKKEPEKLDVYWHILQNRSFKEYEQKNFGLYCNSMFEMAEIQRKQGNLLDALITLLYVCYLDINGPMNGAPFSLSTAFIAPAIVDRIVKIIEFGELTETELEMLFMYSVQSFAQIPALLTADESWQKIKSHIIKI